MKKAVAVEVIASEHGLVVIGGRGPGTRVWFRPANKARLSDRLTEFNMPFEAPRGVPAALLPSGKLLVVGRNSESLTVEVDRSPQPGPRVGPVEIEGLSPDGVAFGRGPQFFRYVEGSWRAEGPAAGPEPRPVRAADGGLAIGADGDAWLAPTWKKVPLKTKAKLNCIAGAWIGGAGVALERKGKLFKLHQIGNEVTAICAWKKGALLVVGGLLFDLSGKPVKAPPNLTSISSWNDELWCVSRGGLYSSTDARAWRRKALPK